jgi:hypothetical protein
VTSKAPRTPCLHPDAFYDCSMTTTRRLSDAQLADAVLDITEPMLVDNLSLDRPDRSLIPTIIGEYHRPRTADPIWCCHCRARRPWNGFVIENDSGFRYLIGSHCGPKYYELSFAQARRQHNDLKQRRGLVVRLEALVARADLILAVVDSILHSKALRSVDEVRSAIEKAGGDAFFRLLPVAMTGGSLSEAVRVRDYAAEARRQNSSSEAAPIYAFENRTLGPLSGAALLISNGDCRDQMLALKQGLASVRALHAKGTDAIGTTAFMKIIRECERAHEAAQSAIRSARQAPDFFSRENVLRLERWSEQFDSFVLRWNVRGLELIPARGPARVIDALPPVNLPDLPPMTVDEFA